MENNNYSKIVFRGYRRVFFLVLAMAMLMQAAAFLYSRLNLGMDLLEQDFKIVVALNNSNEQQSKDFENAITALKGVQEVTPLDPSSVLSSLGGAQAVSSDFLPAFFRIKVSQEVLLNPKAWIQQNITPLNAQANAYYKEDQAHLAVYMQAVNKFILISLGIAAFALLAFGFFVEAYYTKISPLSERAGGIFSAALAYLISAGAAFALAYPVNAISPSWDYCLFCPSQLIIALLCLTLGSTLAKWKKF